MSGNEQVKIKQIALNQLGKDIRQIKLLNQFPGFQMQSLSYRKGNFMLREFKYNQFGASLWKVVWCTERCRENKFP